MEWKMENPLTNCGGSGLCDFAHVFVRLHDAFDSGDGEFGFDVDLIICGRRNIGGSWRR